MEQPEPFDFDENKIRELFDELVAELQNTNENQKSLHRDYTKKKFVELKITSKYVQDKLLLAQYCN